ADRRSPQNDVEETFGQSPWRGRETVPQRGGPVSRSGDCATTRGWPACHFTRHASEELRMIDPVRQEVIALAHTVVVKVGTTVLTGPDGRLDPARLQALTDQVYRLHQTGRKVVLVSSGAIGAGVGRLGLGKRPTDLRQLQACAAVGQGFLMRAYQECLDSHGTHTAQILLTAGDFDDRGRYLNARNTIVTCFEWSVLPIINENDTVSVAEIRFGDNDHLAAMVTNLLQAPLLVLLTNVDGLYAGDPATNAGAELLTTVPEIDGKVMDMAGASKSALGTGGMRSKIRAARLATRQVNRSSWPTVRSRACWTR